MNPKQDTNTSGKFSVWNGAIFIHFTFLFLLLGRVPATTLLTTRAFEAKNNLLSGTDPLRNVSRYIYK